MKTENPVIDRLQKHIEAECKTVDREAQFDDMLDECYSFKSVGGIFANMSPSSVLKEVDPTAYRCGVNDYFGTDDTYTEFAGETYLVEDLESAKQEFIGEIELEISTLESEIEEAKADEDANIQELAAQERQLADLQADLEAVNAHSF